MCTRVNWILINSGREVLLCKLALYSAGKLVIRRLIVSRFQCIAECVKCFVWCRGKDNGKEDNQEHHHGNAASTQADYEIPIHLWRRSCASIARHPIGR